MENKLQEQTTRYNNALRKWVVSEYKRLKDETAKIFMLDTNYLYIVQMSVDSEDCLVYKKSGRRETYNLFLNYYWIEYDYDNEKARKKITFYCKDIDCRTGNVHAIPGIMQNWESVDCYDNELPDIPSLKYEDNNLYIDNVHFKNEYKSFIEENWIPMYCGKDVLMERLDYRKVMPSFFEIQSDYACAENEVRHLIVKKLREEPRADISVQTKSDYTYSNGVKPKYTIIKWINNKAYSDRTINLFDIAYIPGFGIAMNYGKLSVSKNPANSRMTGTDDKIALGYNVVPLENTNNASYFVKDTGSLLNLQFDFGFDGTAKYIKENLQ